MASAQHDFEFAIYQWLLCVSVFFFSLSVQEGVLFFTIVFCVCECQILCLFSSQVSRSRKATCRSDLETNMYPSEILALSTDWTEILDVSCEEGLSIVCIQKGKGTYIWYSAGQDLKSCITNDQAWVPIPVRGLSFPTLSTQAWSQNCKGNVSRCDVSHRRSFLS